MRCTACRPRRRLLLLPLPTRPPPNTAALLQLQEAEQQYAEIYEEYEKGREFFANIESEMHKAQQVRGGGSNATGCCLHWWTLATVGKPSADVVD